MDLYGLFFIIQFLVCVGILGAAMYNVMSSGKTFNIKWSWILFSAYFISWLVGFIIFALEPEEMLYMQLFRLESWLIVLNTLFMAIQQFYIIGDIGLARTRGRRYSLQEYEEAKSD